MLYLTDLDRDALGKIYEHLKGWEYMLKLTCKAMRDAAPKETKMSIIATLMTIPKDKYNIFRVLPPCIGPLVSSSPAAKKARKEWWTNRIKWIRADRNGVDSMNTGGEPNTIKSLDKQMLTVVCDARTTYSLGNFPYLYVLEPAFYFSELDRIIDSMPWAYDTWMEWSDIESDIDA